MIKAWIFEFFTPFHGADSGRFDAARCASDFAFYLQQWRLAEEQGFTGIFFSEHHFFPGRFSPSPNLLIAAVAAVTQRLRLGVMGQVLPFYEPWRCAEECAMLDQLSGGRLEMGFSSGVGPKEFRVIGLPAEEIKPRFAEALDIIGKALTHERFSHSGRFWNFENMLLSPRTLQQPLPPRWITGLSPETAAQAASDGYRLCTGFGSVARVKVLFDAYREAAARAGRAVDAGWLGLRRQILIADDDAEARALGAEATARMRAMFAGPPPSQAPAGAAAPVRTIAPDAPGGAPGGSMIADEETIAGSPRSVAEQIIAQCRATGAGHILGYVPGTVSLAQMARSQELWRQVIPELQRAGG